MSSNHVQLDIGGMSCGSCVSHVRSALARLPGVQVDDVQVGHAVVTIEPAVEEASIRKAIADAGYLLTSIRPANANSAAASNAVPATAGGCCCGGSHAHASTVHAVKRRRVSHPQG